MYKRQVKAIANDVNATLLGLGRKFYGIVGTPGTTPFSTVVDATNARKVLNRQLAPVNDRRIVLDPDAEAAALGLSGFADVSKSGDTRPIIDGTIGRKYGFDLSLIHIFSLGYWPCRRPYCLWTNRSPRWTPSRVNRCSYCL